jgi:hypothetical protein
MQAEAETTYTRDDLHKDFPVDKFKLIPVSSEEEGEMTIVELAFRSKNAVYARLVWLDDGKGYIVVDKDDFLDSVDVDNASYHRNFFQRFWDWVKS